MFLNELKYRQRVSFEWHLTQLDRVSWLVLQTKCKQKLIEAKIIFVHEEI